MTALELDRAVLRFLRASPGHLFYHRTIAEAVGGGATERDVNLSLGRLRERGLVSPQGRAYSHLTLEPG